MSHGNISNAIELSLKTWYKPDNTKYFNPVHPTIKLAGEIGELLDLYAKHLFKPGFDWMDCKCEHSWSYHLTYEGYEPQDKSESIACIFWPIVIGNNEDVCNCNQYTPKVLDELGDVWYYLRILAWQNDMYLSIGQWSKEYTDNLIIIKEMYNQANQFLQNKYDTRAIEEIYYLLLDLLDNLNYTIDQLTELNYQKLNSEPTNHGWSDAA